MKVLIQLWTIRYRDKNLFPHKIQFKTWYDELYKYKTYKVLDCDKNSEKEVTIEEGNEMYKSIVTDKENTEVRLVKII